MAWHNCSKNDFALFSCFIYLIVPDIFTFILWNYLSQVRSCSRVVTLSCEITAVYAELGLFFFPCINVMFIHNKFQLIFLLPSYSVSSGPSAVLQSTQVLTLLHNSASTAVFTSYLIHFSNNA